MIGLEAELGFKETSTGRHRYQSPRLLRYGAVSDLTRSGTGSKVEDAKGSSGQCFSDVTKRPCSERRVKENIMRVGDHPAGFGLYLFDYKAEFADAWGHGRQFGVIIEEVERVIPEAVSFHGDGYKRVDYAMLGMRRYLDA